MKVLLDECIPRKLKKAFAELDCSTVLEAGLAGKKNCVLLSLAEGAGFDVFLTLDRGIQFQQNLACRSIAILIVRARSKHSGSVAACYGVPGGHSVDPARRGRPGRRIENALCWQKW